MLRTNFNAHFRACLNGTLPIKTYTFQHLFDVLKLRLGYELHCARSSKLQNASCHVVATKVPDACNPVLGWEFQEHTVNLINWQHNGLPHLQPRFPPLSANRPPCMYAN